MLRWFGHIKRMSESRLTKGIYKADVVSGNAGRGRPRRTGTLTLLVRFYRKFRFVVLATGVRVCSEFQMYECGRGDRST